MERPKFTVIHGTNGVTYIQAQSFDYDAATGLGSAKTALIPVLPEKAQEIMQKLSAGEYSITFGAKQRGTTLFDAVVNTEVEVEA